MRTSTKFLFASSLFLLVACASLGLLSPKTFEDKLTAAVATHTAAANTVALLLNQKKISSADAENIQAQLVELRKGLDIARSMGKVNPVSAENKLASITTALTAIDAYLTATSSGKGGS